MILTFRADNRTVDIMVKQEQRIDEVYRILSESLRLPACCRETQTRVYSMRRSAYVNPMLTFGQSEIYNGDILVFDIRGKADYEDPDPKERFDGKDRI